MKRIQNKMAFNKTHCQKRKRYRTPADNTVLRSRFIFLVSAMLFLLARITDLIKYYLNRIFFSN